MAVERNSGPGHKRGDSASELQHVARPSLPWRTERQTECGLDAAGRDVITREQFVDKVKREGKQRSALTTCMTCWHTAGKWRDWRQSPTEVMRRHVGGWERDNPQMDAELEAIAALIHEHRDEFDAYLAGIGHTVDLASARKTKRNRAAAQYRGTVL